MSTPPAPRTESMPLSRARANLGALARWVAATGDRVIITSHGHPAAVLIGAEQFAALEAEAAAGAMPRTPSTDPRAGER